MQGMIVEVKKDKAILLNQNGEFFQIDNRHYEIGQNIEQKAKTHKIAIGVAAGFFLLFLMAFSVYAVYNTPITFVSIDMNPSLQASVNRFDKVIQMTPYNKDAKLLLGHISPEHTNVYQMICSVVDTAEKLGYLSEKNDHVQIDIVSKDGALTAKVAKLMQKYTGKGIDVSIETADNFQLSLAKALGLSLGRTKAYLEYTEIFDVDLTDARESLHNSTIKEIRLSIQNHNQAEATATKAEQNADGTDSNLIQLNHGSTSQSMH